MHNIFNLCLLKTGTVEERNVWQDEIEEGTNQIVLNKR
jgi:hypothetical protein